jgi:hypothetical protein
MKIAPLKMSDPWFGRIMADGQVQVDTLKNVPIESTVEMELVELLHGGPESNYRPYLHLRGELTEATPSVELPYGVTDLSLRRGSGLSVDAFYDFSPRQLTELVGKGYFTEEFTVPEEMSGIPWTLPGKADFMVVAPEFSDQPPVVFMYTHDQSDMELDEANSGYDLSSYFHNYSEPTQDQAAPELDEGFFDRSISGVDVFGDVNFDEPGPVDETTQHRRVSDLDHRADVPNGVFNRLVSEIESQHGVDSADDEIVADALPEIPVQLSAAELYRLRVSPGVERVLSGAHMEEVAAESVPVPSEPVQGNDSDLADEDDEFSYEGFLDVNEPEPELTPLPVNTIRVVDAGEGDEAQRKAAGLRAARIRAELTDDDTSPFDDASEPAL